MVEFGMQGDFGALLVFAYKVSRNFVLRGRHELLYFPFTLNNQSHCHRLYAAGTQAGCNLTPQYGTELKAYYTVEYATCLLSVNKVIIYVSRMGNSIFDSAFRYLVERYSMCMSRLQMKHFFQVPGYSFSFTVFIGRQPYCVGFSGFFAQGVYQVNLRRLKHIIGHITIGKVDADIMFPRAFNVSNMSL